MGSILPVSVRMEPLLFGDIKTGKALHTFGGHSSSPWRIVISPDNQFAASAASETLLWDVQTGNVLNTLRYPEGLSYYQVFSPDGQILASVSNSEDKIITLWDVQTGTEVHALQGHSNRIRSVAFSPDSRFLVSGGNDAYTKLWDVKSGKELASLIAIGEEDWVVIAPNGLFDASPGAMQHHMHWVVGTEPIEFNQLKVRYYEPGLLAKLLNDEDLRQVPGFADIDLYPELEWLDSDRSDPTATLRLTNQGGGIGKIVVFINGKEFTSDARSRGTNPEAKEIEIEIDVSEHPFLIPGKENHIEVKVWNGLLSLGYPIIRGRNSICALRLKTQGIWQQRYILPQDVYSEEKICI